MREELELIKKIRVRNNDLWVSILDIALRHAPNETKIVMAEIRANDQKVSEQMGNILNGDTAEKS